MLLSRRLPCKLSSRGSGGVSLWPARRSDVMPGGDTGRCCCHSSCSARACLHTASAASAAAVLAAVEAASGSGSALALRLIAAATEVVAQGRLADRGTCDHNALDVPAEAAAVHAAVEAAGSAAGTTPSCSTCSTCSCSLQRVTNWSTCDDCFPAHVELASATAHHQRRRISHIRINTASSRDGSRSCNSSEIGAALDGRRGLPYNPLCKLYSRLLKQYSGTPLKYRTVKH